MDWPCERKVFVLYIVKEELMRDHKQQRSKKKFVYPTTLVQISESDASAFPTPFGARDYGRSDECP